MKINKLRILASQKGFTLIELMIVIAIIGILAAIAIPNFISYRDKAFCSSAEADAGSIAAALASYFAVPSHVSLTPPSGGLPLTLTSSGTHDSEGLTTLKFSKLTGKNTATIGGGLKAVRITVYEAAERCPKDYMDGQKAAGWDTDEFMFTKTME